jgi:hypothetical protein
MPTHCASPYHDDSEFAERPLRFAAPDSTMGAACMAIWRITCFGYLFGVTTYQWCCVQEIPSKHLT